MTRSREPAQKRRILQLVSTETTFPGCLSVAAVIRNEGWLMKDGSLTKVPGDNNVVFDLSTEQGQRELSEALYEITSSDFKARISRPTGNDLYSLVDYLHNKFVVPTTTFLPNGREHSYDLDLMVQHAVDAVGAQRDAAALTAR